MNNFFIHILSWLRYDKIFRKKKKKQKQEKLFKETKK